MKRQAGDGETFSKLTLANCFCFGQAGVYCAVKEASRSFHEEYFLAPGIAERHAHSSSCQRVYCWVHCRIADIYIYIYIYVYFQWDWYFSTFVTMYIYASGAVSDPIGKHNFLVLGVSGGRGSGGCNNVYIIASDFRRCNVTWRCL